jgi:hypothetical protein
MNGRQFRPPQRTSLRHNRIDSELSAYKSAQFVKTMREDCEAFRQIFFLRHNLFR